MKRLVVGLLVGITCLLGVSNVMAEQPETEGILWLTYADDSPVFKATYTGKDAGWGLWGETQSSEFFSSGVLGYASAEIGFTFGVLGISISSNGIGVGGSGSIGVRGISNADKTNEDSPTAGVVAVNQNPNGYAMYSHGNMHVTGNLTVDGSIESTNLALNTDANLVTVWASSEHGPLMIQGKECTYLKSYINDGKAGYWDKYEWATDGEKNGNFKYYDPSTGLKGAKIELKWKFPLWKMTRVVIYPRPNKYDKIEDCWLQVMQVINVDTGETAVTNIHLGQIHTPREIKLEDAEGANVIAVGVLITETTSNTVNIGLAEIECYVE